LLQCSAFLSSPPVLDAEVSKIREEPWAFDDKGGVVVQAFIASRLSRRPGPMPRRTAALTMLANVAAALPPKPAVAEAGAGSNKQENMWIGVHEMNSKWRNVSAYRADYPINLTEIVGAFAGVSRNVWAPRRSRRLFGIAKTIEPIW